MMNTRKWTKNLSTLVTILALTTLTPAAYSASFDCDKAESRIEKLICADPELSKLDEQMQKTFSKAMGLKSQETAIKKSQKQWLHDRNNCDDVGCVKRAYEMRLASLTILQTTIDDGVVAQQKAKPRVPRGDWTYRGSSGRNEPLCHALLRRLNRYDRDDKKPLNGCSFPVMASYPEFTVPPWEELDIRQHKELLFKLMKYRQEGPYWLPGLKPWASDPYMVRKEAQFSDEKYRNDVKRFIEEGGRIRVWRTRLLNYYRGNNGLIPVPPGEEQIIVQIYIPSKADGTQDSCPGKPRPIQEYFDKRIVIVTPDLNGPDPNIDPGTFAILGGRDLLIYQSKPVFVGVEDVWRVGELMLDGICDYEFVEWKK